MKRKWGRDVAFDERDGKYRFALRATNLKSRSWRSSGWQGDQLDTPHCVGFGWAHWLHAAPYRQYIDPNGIYAMAQHYDEWEGTEYDGSSVRGGAKVLSMLGAIDRYAWTWDADQVVQHILAISPVVIGVNWYKGMMDVNDLGMMAPKGRLLGGHCVCVVGYNGKTGALTIKNSWGPEWGDNGYGYLAVEDLQRLLNEDGEACVGYEQKMRP